MSVKSGFGKSTDLNTTEELQINETLLNKINKILSIVLEENEALEYRKYDDPVVNRVIEELDKEKYEKFSLDKISKNVSYSKSYLCRQFKKVTGVTIIYYFYSLKVEEAKKMLIHGDHTIEETSDLLNFDSVQYFSKVFKKYSGLSPSNWRTVSSKRMYF